MAAGAWAGALQRRSAAPPAGGDGASADSSGAGPGASALQDGSALQDAGALQAALEASNAEVARLRTELQVLRNIVLAQSQGADT